MLVGSPGHPMTTYHDLTFSLFSYLEFHPIYHHLSIDQGKLERPNPVRETIPKMAHNIQVNVKYFNGLV
jgi:hypothetical protein